MNTIKTREIRSIFLIGLSLSSGSRVYFVGFALIVVQSITKKMEKEMKNEKC